MSADLLHRILDPEVAGERYGIYRTLRDEAPVVWSDRFGSWIVSRYEDAKAVLDDPDGFSSAGRVKERDVTPVLWSSFAGFDGFFWSDPPAYTEYREIWTRAFKPRLKGIAGVVQRVVDELLDEAAATGSFDAVTALAFPLPATVIFKILGVPREDRDMFRRVSSSLIENGAPAAVAMDEAGEWLQDFLADRQSNPRDDILSDLVIDRPPIGDADPLALRREIVDIVQFLLAGHETTTSTIATGLNEFVRRPRDKERFLADRGLRPRAVEEFLRYESPLQFIERRVRKQTTLRGRVLEAESAVRLLLGSANHDERAFESPDELILDRSPNPHLAFGHGVHLCLGAPLARIEIPIALETTLRRFPELRLDSPEDAVPWRQNFMFHAIESLPLTVG